MASQTNHQCGRVSASHERLSGNGLTGDTCFVNARFGVISLPAKIDYWDYVVCHASGKHAPDINQSLVEKSQWPQF